MNKQIIKKLLQNKKNPIVFEIGSADSNDTVDFLNIFENQIKIYCFEPEPTNLVLAKQKLSQNLGKNVFLFEGAISNKSEIVPFNRSRTKNPNDLRYSGSLLKPKNHLLEWNWIYFDEFVPVKTITLDDFCQINSINSIDFIWADVQGAEKLLIIGGKKVLKNKVNYLYTEYSNKEYYENQPTLTELLNELGENWVIVQDFGSDVLLKNTNFIDTQE